MKLCLTIAAALALAATSAFAGWTDNFDDALKQAAQDKKLALLDFTGSDWCGWCVKLNKEVFSTPAFKEFAAKNLILVEIDFPRGKELPANVQKQNEALQNKFKIEGYPTIILVDGAGKEVARGGYIQGGPTAFIDWIKKAQK